MNMSGILKELGEKKPETPRMYSSPAGGRAP
jgi:hypothetical protein